MNTRYKSIPRGITVVLMAILAMFMSFGSVTPAFAQDGAESQQAQNELQSYVKTEVAGNIYTLDGGGTITGNDLLVLNDNTRQYEIDGVRFSQLETDDQRQFISDITTSANYAADPANPSKSPIVTDQTVTNWFRALQDTPGVGSRMLSEMMGATAPDFIGAQQILSPFQKGLNIILGIIGVIIMLGLSFTILLDVAYMVVPFVRSAIGDGDSGSGDKGGKVKKVFSVSTDARNAMKKADSEDGSTSSALLKYLWSRSFGLLVLGVLLVLLVNGSLFNLVGVVMDLTSGYFGD